MASVGHGDKVGEAYIEVTPVLNKRQLALQAQARKQLDTFGKELDKSMGGAFQRNIDSVIKKSATRQFSENIKLANRLESQKLKAFKATEVRIAAEIKNRAKAYAKLDAEVERQRSRRQQGGGRRRGKDGGALSFGEGLENVASILPGQIEKLFRSPAITGVALAAGVALWDSISLGLGAGIAGAATTGVLIGGIVALVKNDTEVAAAFQVMGKNALAGFLKFVQPLKGNLINAVTALSGSLDTLFKSLDARPVARSITSLQKGISGFLKNATPGFQALLNVGEQVFAALGEKFLPALGLAFSHLGQTIMENRGAIVAAFRIIGAVVIKTVDFISANIGAAADVFNFFSDRIADAARTFLGLLGVIKSLPGGNLVPGIDKAASGLEKFISTIEDTKANAPLATGGIRDMALTLKGSLDPALMSVNKSLEEQKAAYLGVVEAQNTFDQNLQTSLDPVIAIREAMLDFTASIKENGKVGGATTKPQIQAYKDTASTLQTLKLKLQEQVTQQKLTKEQAEKSFAAQSAAILRTAGATGTARAALAGYRADLSTFQGLTINVNLQVHTNIQSTLDALRGLKGEAARARAETKNKATGGAIRGPGTGTSDSIPANLSNGEFVIKASSASKIGMANLAAMNATGKMPQGFAGGTATVRGQGRGKTAAQVRQYNLLLKQISALTKTVTSQTKQLAAYTEKTNEVMSTLDQFVSLGNVETQGKTAGDVLNQLVAKREKTKSFAADVGKLKGLGLGKEALDQIIAAGPESDIAGLLAGGISSLDTGQINSLLGGDAELAGQIAGNVAAPPTGLASNKARLAAKKKKAAALKAPKARGATISYAGGRISALFSKKELQDQQLKTGTYVTVMIDGKEVRALVRQDAAKSNRNLKSGRR